AGHEKVGIINLDAHLDLRPLLDGKGHSGSPFRQALEHHTHPLGRERYVCLGAQPHSVSRAHWLLACDHGYTIRWCSEVRHSLERWFLDEHNRLTAAGSAVYVTLDADVVQTADVPGVSAPNGTGLLGSEVATCARVIGMSPGVTSFDLV